MRFELFIATRYLRAKRRQAFIGIITGISVAGVAAGVASLVVALAINNGFRQDLQQRLLGSTSHISLQRIADDGIKDWPALLDRLSKQPHVVAAAPAIFEQVLISRGPRARGAVLKGMIPRYERRVGDLLNSVKEGSAAPLEDTDNNATSDAEADSKPESKSKAADKSVRSTQTDLHNLPIPSPPSTSASPPCRPSSSARTWPTISAPKSETPCSSPARKANSLPSAWCPSTTASKSSESSTPASSTTIPVWAFARLSDAQKLFGLGDLISVLEFKIDDLDQADAIAHEIEDAAGQGFMATNALRQNSALFKALKTERLVTFITIGLIVFVAALNILISLIMMVMEKTKDIAVLMSMGTRRAQVRNLFIAQGVLIGIVGTAIGLVLGYAISYAGGHYHIISLSPEVYSIDYVPFAPRLWDGARAAAFSLIISFLATLYPSWSAARILPAEALRYE